MEWFENKTTQLIALVSIVGTLAGFGYTGATYVNRIENLEAKIEKTEETDDGLGEIEKRFEYLESTVKYLDKTLDNTLTRIDFNESDTIEIKTTVSAIKADVSSIKTDIQIIKEDKTNPLAN